MATLSWKIFQTTTKTTLSNHKRRSPNTLLQQPLQKLLSLIFKWMLKAFNNVLSLHSYRFWFTRISRTYCFFLRQSPLQRFTAISTPEVLPVVRSIFKMELRFLNRTSSASDCRFTSETSFPVNSGYFATCLASDYESPQLRMCITIQFRTDVVPPSAGSFLKCAMGY